MTAADLLAELTARGLLIGCAESVTGGLVCGALTAVPGSSAAVRGSVVAYATEVKASVLGVDPELLARSGPVHPEVAAQLADGVCRVLDCDVGLATTGVAGPQPQSGQPVGTVYVAVGMPARRLMQVRRLSLTGPRPQVRAATVDAVLALALDLLRSDETLRRER